MAEADVGRVQDTPAGGSSIDFAFTVRLNPRAIRVGLPGILPILATGLVLRLALAFLQSFQIDTGTFQAWSAQVAIHHVEGQGLIGPWDFYDTDFFTDYAPGYMYVLWLFGQLNQVFHLSLAEFEYILKLPSIAADIGSAYVLYLLLRDQKHEYRIGAAALYLLFPPVLLIGPVWGQVDSLLAFFLLLSVYFIGRERPMAGALAYTVGFLVKPQIIAALPFLAFWIIRRYRSENPVQPSTQFLTGLSILAVGTAGLLLVEEEPRAAYRIVFGGVIAVGGIEALRGLARLALDQSQLMMQGGLPLRGVLLSFPIWYQAVGVSLALALILVFPFFTYKPWEIIGQLYDANEVYPVNSFFAYNFWTSGFWSGGLSHGFQPDVAGIQPGQGTFLGVDHRYWALALFFVSTAAIIGVMWRSEGTGALALGAALCVLVFYLFMTRMHERYLFAFFLPFLAAAVALRSRVLLAAFFGLGLIHFFNLYHVYVYYQHTLKWNSLYNWFEKTNTLGTGLDTVQFLSILMVIALPLLIAAAYVIANQPRRAGVT